MPKWADRPAFGSATVPRSDGEWSGVRTGRRRSRSWGTMPGARASFFPRMRAAGAASLHRRRHHVVVQIGNNPARPGDNEEDNEQAESEGQDIVRVIGPA